MEYFPPSLIGSPVLCLYHTEIQRQECGHKKEQVRPELRGGAKNQSETQVSALVNIVVCLMHISLN